MVSFENRRVVFWCGSFLISISLFFNVCMASDTPAKTLAIDACNAVPSSHFETLLGGSVRTMGKVYNSDRGWHSDCHFKADGFFWVTLNGSFSPSTTSQELSASVEKHMGKAITKLAVIEGFKQPSVSFFHPEMNMHFITLQHGRYWIQLGSTDPELAKQAIVIYTKYAP